MIDTSNLPAPAFGPTGQTVYERTYSRPLPDGTPETWADTVKRVVEGNLGLVHGKPSTWDEDVEAEAEALFEAIYGFSIIPAGRHLWASGIPGRQYLFNCHVSGWGETFADHFEFTLLRLAEGGGVGANYSSTYVGAYGAPKRRLRLHVTADETHADYAAMSEAGLLSETYADSWPGAYRVEDSREGWAAALVDLISTYFADDVEHENRVYTVSGVRPKGSPLRTFGGTASGPLPLARLLHTTAEVLNRAFERGHITPLDAMEIDHGIGECIVAGGVRRSARMSIVKWDDPYVFDFIACKSDPALHWTTNVSVEIDDRFLAALAGGGDPVTGWNEIDGRTVNEAEWASAVHEAVVAGMLANGEPGYWNSSLSNVGETGYVEATNPCGEIALEAWENCNLGHVNLEAFAHDEDGGERIAEAHRLMTRFLMRATFGDVTSPVQAARLDRNRRIGVGHLGVQGFLVRKGIRYSDAAMMPEFGELLRALKGVVRDEARAYAFDLRIPEPVKVTTVAPTGTIAKMPGATEGIHPVYARYFLRRIRFSDLRAEERAQVEEFRAKGYNVEPCQYAPNTTVVEIPTKERLVQIVEDLGFEPEIVEDASEIPLRAMLAFQRTYQANYADNAVSFTVNVPEGRYTVEEVAEALADFLPVLKGTTLMPDGTRPQAPYERISPMRYGYEARRVGVIVDDSFDEECASGACPVK